MLIWGWIFFGAGSKGHGSEHFEVRWKIIATT